MMKNKQNDYNKKYRRQVMRLVKQNWLLYIFILPAFIYMITFCYAPMYGLQIAFRNYTFSKGIVGSEWVGLKWFIKFFNTPRFWTILKNTLTISIYTIVVSFPLPVILALVLNNVKNPGWKKFSQTITYMPHFISVVVMVGMLSIFFSPRNGIVNTILSWFGGSGDVYFLGSAEYFPHMYVWSGVWQSMGWSSIIYMAALAGVDPSLQEAAMIDGANKFQRMCHIDLPTILPTIAIMLIMSCGNVLNVGYEKAFLMQNNLTLETAEIISTYVYKMGLLNQQFGYSTAIGLFNNVISFAVLILVNKIVSKLTGSGLW